MKQYEKLLEICRADPDGVAEALVAAGISGTVSDALDLAEFERDMFGLERSDPTGVDVLRSRRGDEIEVELWERDEGCVAALRDLPGFVVHAASRSDALEALAMPLVAAEEAGLV